MGSKVEGISLPIKALVASLIGLLFIQLASKPMGYPPIPFRLMVFVLVADGCAICCLLWQARRERASTVSPQPIQTEASSQATMSNIAKALGVYAVLEALACGIVFIAVRIPIRKLLFGYILFFVPTLVALPIVMQAGRFLGQPRSYARWFAIAVFLLVMLLGVAMFYSGILGWLIPGSTTDHDALLGAAFGGVIAAFGAYRSVYTRLASAKS